MTIAKISLHCILNFDVIECHERTGENHAAATGENHTLSPYEMKHSVFFCLFVFVFAFSESLFAKSHSFTSFNSLLTIWKSDFRGESQSIFVRNAS